jgi:uncharacterized membrane protein YedE/YeeE
MFVYSAFLLACITVLVITILTLTDVVDWFGHNKLGLGVLAIVAGCLGGLFLYALIDEIRPLPHTPEIV